MAENFRSRRGRRSDSSPHNSIACEPCRTKKRRCDRRLPVCLQCTHDPSQCHYPEQNKRGLPLGYVNKLEARLAETEAALFHILKQKHGGDSEPSLSYIPPALRSSISTGRNKTERLKEWERLPLRSMSEVHSWYCSKAAEGCRGATPPMTNSSSASQVPAVHETETLWGPDTRPGDRLELALAGAAPTTGVAIESPESNASRAKELSQSQPHLYF